jgi:hypothetical protein
MDTSISDDDAKKAAGAFTSGTQVATVKVTDAAGTQQLDVRRDKDKNYYARSSVVEGIHKLDSTTGEGFDKGLEDFRNKKLFDFGFNDPTKIEVRDGAKTVTLAKSGDKWMSGNKQMDSTSVQNLIDKLRDLASTKFLDQAFANPVLEATVTSNDGKLTEKVLINKQGDKHFAKRENEPPVYEVESSAVQELQKALADVKEHQPPKDEKKK